MNSVYFMIVAAAFLLTAGADGRAPKDDLAILQGGWLTVSQVSDGKTIVDENAPPKPGPVVKVVYEGNKWMVKVGDQTVATGTFKIDPSKTPKELDVMDESGTVNARTKLAIYELDGDRFKYCIAADGKPRPAAFTSVAGSGWSLIVSKHEKAK